jgi:hypothetical protein
LTVISCISVSISISVSTQDRRKRILGMRLPWALVMRHRLVL